LNAFGNAVLEKGVELVLDEPRRLTAGAGFGVGGDAGHVLLRQAVQRGLLRAMALVLERGAIGRLLGLPANGLHVELPWWKAPTVSSCALRLYRPECHLPACARR
jgi:hypothetical protein